MPETSVSSSPVDAIPPLGWVINLTRQILWSVDQHTTNAFDGWLLPCDPSSSELSLAQIAIGLEPTALGVAQIYNHKPYTNPEQIRRELDDAVSSGWLTSSGEGLYWVSQQGREVCEKVRQKLDQIFCRMNRFPNAQLEEILTTLDKVIDAIKNKGTLSYHPSFDLDMKLGNGTHAVLQQICTRLSHVLAYRDDAYLNAWMGQEVNGYVWEAFSCIYKGEAQNAGEIADRLTHKRFFDVDTYWGAVSELLERGWIQNLDGNCIPTNLGIEILAKVARAMNNTFYQPWLVLDESEATRLKEGLETLASALKICKPRYGAGYAQVNRTLGWGTVQWARDKVR